jgi:hypothetical protein
MKNKLINITLCLISLITSFYILELIIFFLITKNISTNLNKLNFDTRSRAEIFYDLKKKNHDVVLSVYPYVFLKDQNQSIFPLSGISNKETIFCNENGYYAIYNSDRYGFNNPDKIWDNQKIDYLIVGDSFAQGMCVNEPDNFSGNLKRITKKNIINLGMSGNGPIREFATIKEYMAIKKPKIVLWFYFEGNDLTDIDDEVKNNILSKYFLNNTFTQDLRNKQNIIDKKLSKKMFEKLNEDYETRQVINNSYFLRFLKLYTLRNYLESLVSIKKDKNPKQEDVNKLKKILISAKKFIEDEHGAKLYFIYLPTYIRYSNSIKNNNDNLFLYGEVKKIVKELNINFIDVNKDVIGVSKQPLSFFPFGMSGHYSVYGYKIISEFIAKNISQ